MQNAEPNDNSLMIFLLSALWFLDLLKRSHISHLHVIRELTNVSEIQELQLQFCLSSHQPVMYFPLFANNQQFLAYRLICLQR